MLSPVIEPTTPVLVGVGTCLDDAEPVELMSRAALAAGDDAGAADLLASVGRIAVPRGTWSYTDPARIVAERIGASNARTVLVDLGIPQQTPINDALRSIMAGELEAALIVGAEAKARAARAAKRSVAADAAGISQMMQRTAAPAGETDQGGAEPDEHQIPKAEIIAQAELSAGLWAPVEQYALIESALGAAEGRSLADHRADIAGLWARCNAVAGDNPEAAFPAPMDAAAISQLGPGNRPLAFPYGKWHVSQWTVDQGAALLLCSAAAAERAGVPRDRWIFPLAGLESSWSLSLSKRADLHRWPAMGVLGKAAAAHLGRPLASCEHAEVYSCFPVAMRVQQRELGLPLDGTPTITGGMAFAGGPLNNFVLQATAAMARRLRKQPGTGLVTTVSGLLTKPGLALWSSEPGEGGPLVADLAAEAEAATRELDAVVGYEGGAVVAAATVTYDAMEPSEVIAILDTPDSHRAVARSLDLELARRAVTDGLVGAAVEVNSGVLRSV